MSSGQAAAVSCVDQRVLGGQHHVGGAEQRVGPGGEHLDAGPAARRRRRWGSVTRAPSDRPIQLRCCSLIGLGPVEHVQVADQPVGVGRDAHHPLLQRPPEHGEVAALAAPVGRDLLVGQHRAQARAPVDRRLLHVGQAVVVDDHPPLGGRQLGPRPAGRVGALARLAGAGVQLGHQVVDGPGPVGVGVVPGVEDLQEDPLRPAVVALVDRGDRPPGVVAPGPGAAAGGAWWRCWPRWWCGGAGRSAPRTARPAGRRRRSPWCARRCARSCAGSGRRRRCRCSPAGGRRAGRRRWGRGTCPARTAWAGRPPCRTRRSGRRPGWGVRNVPSRSQRSCQAVSICPASAAV